jgi:hypothetical protein
MAFMEPQVAYGSFYEIDGPRGTEYVPAELVGEITITHADGHVEKRFPTLDELQEFDRAEGNLTEDTDGDSCRFPIPSALVDYCENKEAWRIDLIAGFGARLSAPGYLDCTDWCVFETEKEAWDYLRETYLDDEGDDDGSER